LPSQMIDTLKLLKLTMGNHFSRGILRIGLKPCPFNGTTEIEHALAIYSGQSHSAGISCAMYSSLISAILRASSSIFDVNPEELKDYLKDKTTRRGLVSVLRGIANYGITKPQILDAPFLVVWNYTNACNLKCKHCYQNAGKQTSDELTLKQKLKVVDELDEAGIVALAFSGGEPLIKRDFFEVAKRVNERGIFIAIATNGTLITKDMARKLKEVGVGYIEVSLDSTNPKVHDEFRGVPGAFERTIKGIKNCVAEGLYTCIATTFTKINLNEELPIVELGKKLGVKRCLFFNFIPEGRGQDIVQFDPTPEEREKFLQTMVYRSLEGGIEVLSTAPQLARVALQISEGKVVAPTHFYAGEAVKGLDILAEFIGGCGAGRLYCAIQPNGDVSPCVFMHSKIVGNILREPFLEIWRNNKELRMLRDRDLLKGNCGKCSYKYICGGCRARALAYTGDLMGPDPGCINNIEYYERFVKELAAKPLH